MRIPIYSGHLFRQITGRLNTAVLVRPVDLWTRRYRYNSAWLLTMVALPTSPQAQHQSKWPDLNRNRWPVLSEIRTAMVAFLADAYPETGLAPPPGASRERADYLQMIQFGSTSMDMMLSQVRIHEHMLPQSERDPRMAARYRKKFLEEVEPQLARRVRGDAVCLRRYVHRRGLHHRLQCVLGEGLRALPGRSVPALPEVAEDAPSPRRRPRGCARILSGRARRRAHHVQVYGIGVRPL